MASRRGGPAESGLPSGRMRRSEMVAQAVVIGVGNEFRRDDAAGPAVVALLNGQVPEGVTLTVSDGEPTRLIEAWAGYPLAIRGGAVGGGAARAGAPAP